MANIENPGPIKVERKCRPQRTWTICSIALIASLLGFGRSITSTQHENDYASQNIYHFALQELSRCRLCVLLFAFAIMAWYFERKRRQRLRDARAIEEFPTTNDLPVLLTFSGAGMCWGFQLGVATYLLDHFHFDVGNDVVLAGISQGGTLVSMLAQGGSVMKIYKIYCLWSEQVRRRYLYNMFMTHKVVDDQWHFCNRYARWHNEDTIKAFADRRAILYASDALFGAHHPITGITNVSDWFNAVSACCRIPPFFCTPGRSVDREWLGTLLLDGMFGGLFGVPPQWRRGHIKQNGKDEHGKKNQTCCHSRVVYVICGHERFLRVAYSILHPLSSWIVGAEDSRTFLGKESCLVTPRLDQEILEQSGVKFCSKFELSKTEPSSSSSQAPQASTKVDGQVGIFAASVKAVKRWYCTITSGITLRHILSIYEPVEAFRIGYASAACVHKNLRRAGFREKDEARDGCWLNKCDAWCAKFLQVSPADLYEKVATLPDYDGNLNIRSPDFEQ